MKVGKADDSRPTVEFALTPFVLPEVRPDCGRQWWPFGRTEQASDRWEQGGVSSHETEAAPGLPSALVRRAESPQGDGSL